MRANVLPVEPAANEGPAPAPREAGTQPWPPLARSDLAGLVRLVDLQLRQARRQGQKLAVLALRVTHIEGEAEAGAHQPPADDEAALLLELGRRLRLRVRAHDSVVWLGGRDFGVVLVNVDEAQARMVAARLGRVVGGLYRLGLPLWRVQLALGVAPQGPAPQPGGMALVERAMEALAG